MVRSVREDASDSEKARSIEYVINQQPHVQNQESMLAKAIRERKHVCVMLPKFHCECKSIAILNTWQATTVTAGGSNSLCVRQRN